MFLGSLLIVATSYGNYHGSRGMSHVTPDYESLYDPEEYVMSHPATKPITDSEESIWGGFGY